ncbi:MAG: T9SS type A sorting domain-containing protein [Saprospiraceae bacterium]|nr:T9SS type A sorting domain-containing protein [Saprospiraceae bacterium]
MKTTFLINPIPKCLNCVLFVRTLFIYSGLLFCYELKAIPEDWPSTDRLESPLMVQSVDAQAITCIGNLQISLDSLGRAVLTPQMLLVGYYPSYNRFKVLINQTSINVVTCNDIGKKLSATVIDTTNGMMCWTQIAVEDKLKPVITCNADTISCANDPFTFDYSPYVKITDNCDSDVDQYYDLTLSLFDCSNSRYSAVVHLKWIAIDNYGNTNSCIQDIYFKKASVDSVSFPENDTVYCPNPDLSSTGVPLMFGDTVSHLCNLIVTHADDSIIVCGGMMKIRRLWSVMDWCTQAIRSQTQEILVSDTTRPHVICPRDSILFSGYSSCKVNYTIPSFKASDACSPSNLLILVVRLDSSILLRPGQTILLDSGKHSFNYIAIDPCGNSDTCTSYVWVKDRITPSLVCPPALIVSLDPRGQVILTAEHVASRGLVTDNCCIDTVLIRRMSASCGYPQDTLYSDEVHFCCEDIRDTIMLVLKATDCSGNMNFCMIQIYVQDKNPVAPPSCPNDITISCSVDYTDLGETGAYYVVTSCLDSITSTFRDSLAIDSCRNGAVYRKFYLSYPDGSADSSCSQVINILNNYRFSPSDIIWPRDTIIPECVSKDPNALQSFPTDPLDTCGSVYFSYADLQLQFTADSCEITDRVWTAYSACTQETIKDTQRIIAVSLKRSKLVVARDTTIANGPDSCYKYINLVSATLSGCSRFATITNSFNNGGANASGRYPVGTTHVVFTAKDSCGSIKDTTTVIVLDLENPRISCKVLFLDMNSNDTIKLTARELLNSYVDNCTKPSMLRISFNASDPNDTCKYITCADLQTIPDTFDIAVFVKDSSGNVGSCTAKVHVRDPNFYCTTTVRIGFVSGLIKADKKGVMKDVEVFLDGYNQKVETDDQGNYLFYNIVTNQQYAIRPLSDKNWSEDLSTLDIVKIQRHILGLEEFSSPLEWIAADVDHNGRITTADISWLRKIILGKVNAVPGNKSWRFMREDYTFKDPEYPLEELLEESILLKGNWQDTVVNFKGIKVGDVSGVHSLQTLDSRLRNSELIIDNKTFLDGDLIQLDVRLKKEMELEGIQIALSLDPSSLELYRIEEFLGTEAGRALNQDEYFYDGKNLRIAVIQSDPKISLKTNKLVRLVFKAFKKNTISNCVFLNVQERNEIYPKSDVPLKILLNYGEVFETHEPLTEWHIDPNPFKERTWIGFNSKAEQTGIFSLYDLTGKLVLERKLLIHKGSNGFILESKELPQAGTYIYSIRDNQSSYNGKIINTE